MQQTKSMDTPDLNQKSILVVEDEERNWFLLRDIIQLCNGDAIWAQSGMEAIKLVEEEEIDLIFMDIRLPFMKGTEVTKKIKQLKPDIPVIAQTAFSEKKHIDEYNKAGCDFCIFKPLGFHEVIEVLSRYV